VTGAVSVAELAMRSDDQCPIAKGRYLMKPPGSPKLVSVQRMTNFIKAVEDTYNLNRWECRNVAIGIAKCDDLREMVIATRPEDKDGLNQICDLAKEQAGGNAKARGGTARHGVIERILRGEMSIDDVPMPLRADIAACLTVFKEAGIQILDVERYVLHDDLLVGGRYDARVSFGSKPMKLDVKTGSLDFSGVSIAAQLYGYASAPWWYDPKTEKCTPAPETDTDIAVVAHVPAGEGRCTLYFVDLAVGREAFELAEKIRAVRKRRDVFEAWQPGTRLDSLIERRAGIVARLETLRTTNPAALLELARNWPLDIPTLKHSQDHSADQLSIIDTLLCTIEDRHQAPFGPTDPNHNASLKEPA
jgi:hypothetical protein